MDFKIASQPVQLSKKASFAGTVFESVFFIILIIVGFIYLVSPKQSEYGELKDKKAALTEQRGRLENQKVTFDQLVQTLKSNPDGAKLVDSILPLDGNPSRIYILVESLAQRAGLNSAVVSVTTSPSIPVAGKNQGVNSNNTERSLTRTAITINATGTMEQLQNLFSLLETSLRIVQVKSLDISQGSGDQLVFKIGAETYAYLPGK